MVYIFIYNVIQIKFDFSRLKKLALASKFILISSPYGLKRLSVKNRCCFDELHQITRNFRTINCAEVETILTHYIKQYGAQSIRLLSNEESTQMVCANLREKYSIPGPNLNTIIPFVNKIISKVKLNNIVRIPKFIQFAKTEYIKDKATYLNNIIQTINFPMFSKPIDLVSSIDTSFIPDQNTLSIVAEKIFSSSYEFEIDEFIDGDLFHCDCIIHNEKMKFFACSKYAFPLATFSKGNPMGSIPVIDAKTHQVIKDSCEKILLQLGYFSSAFHLEIFIEKTSQELVFLEIAARAPGALVPRMYKLMYNINIEELHYLAQMNLLEDIEIPKNENNIYAAWITYPLVNGILNKINKPDINIKHTFIEHVYCGDKLTQAKNLLDASCSIIMWDDSYTKLEKYFEQLKSYLPLELDISKMN